MKFQFFVGLIFLVLIFGCMSRPSTPFDDILLRLEGEWAEAPGIGYREVWVRKGNQMTGAGFVHAGNTFSQVEELAISVSDTSLIYQALVFEQNQGRQIDFWLMQNTDSSLVFVNPEHDFPNIIGYYFVNDTTLQVRVKSLTNTDEGFELTLKKMPKPIGGLRQN